MLATTRSMRSMVFGTMRSIPRSQQANYQDFIIWSCGKTTLRKRIPKSLHRQSSNFEGLSSPTTKIIQESRQWHLPPSTWFRQWVGHPLHPSQQSSLERLQKRIKADLLGPQRPQQKNVPDLSDSPPSTSGLRSPRPLSYSIAPGFSPKSSLLIG